jgi:hypothetical protein
MGIGKIIAIIGGVAVGAVGAYNYSSTGCPLGTTGACDTGEASVQTVAAQQDDACALGCSMDAADVATLAVAESEADSCCSKEAVEAVADSCCSKEGSKDSGVALLSVSETTEAEAGEADACVGEEAECCGKCVEGAESTACKAEAKEGCCQDKKSDG